ncbi:hypothetical protein GCM10009715_21490 [Paeniglutamicibacter psychrophenolicus]
MIVDADAALARSVTLQCFQAIPWRHAQSIQDCRSIQLAELAIRGLTESRIKSFAGSQRRDALGVTVD